MLIRLDICISDGGALGGGTAVVSIDKFNDWGGRGCNIFVPVLGGNGTKIAPTGDRFDQPPGQMRWIWGKLADHVGDHVVLSPEGAVLMTSPGTKSSYPRPPQSLNPSIVVRVGAVTFVTTVTICCDSNVDAW